MTPRRDVFRVTGSRELPVLEKDTKDVSEHQKVDPFYYLKESFNPLINGSKYVRESATLKDLVRNPVILEGELLERGDVNTPTWEMDLKRKLNLLDPGNLEKLNGLHQGLAASAQKFMMSHYGLPTDKEMTFSPPKQPKSESLSWEEINKIIHYSKQGSVYSFVNRIDFLTLHKPLEDGMGLFMNMNGVLTKIDYENMVWEDNGKIYENFDSYYTYIMKGLELGKIQPFASLTVVGSIDISREPVDATYEIQVDNYFKDLQYVGPKRDPDSPEIQVLIDVAPVTERLAELEKVVPVKMVAKRDQPITAKKLYDLNFKTYNILSKKIEEAQKELQVEMTKIPGELDKPKSGRKSKAFPKEFLAGLKLKRPTKEGAILNPTLVVEIPRMKDKSTRSHDTLKCAMNERGETELTLNAGAEEDAVILLIDRARAMAPVTMDAFLKDADEKNLKFVLSIIEGIKLGGYEQSMTLDPADLQVLENDETAIGAHYRKIKEMDKGEFAEYVRSHGNQPLGAMFDEDYAEARRFRAAKQGAGAGVGRGLDQGVSLPLVFQAKAGATEGGKKFEEEVVEKPKVRPGKKE